MGLPWNAVLSVGAAALWGGGDFTGGMGVRRAGGSVGAALRVVLLSHAVSLCGLMVMMWGWRLTPGGLVWGLVGGVVGGLAIVVFYVALSRGAMGSAAAVSGVLAAAIPAGVSSWIDGRPGWLQVAGFAAAGGAIWMIAGGKRGGAMGLAAISGAGFGVYFVCLRYAAAGGSVWAMGAARMASVTLCSVLLAALAARGEELGRLDRGVAVWAVGSAAMDTSGNLLFMAATRVGRLDVAAVLASLYPASTILLAAYMLRERPTRRQAMGMAVAAAAVALIAA